MTDRSPGSVRPGDSHSPVRDAVTAARLSRGASGDAIYDMVVRALDGRWDGGVLVDVGCGGGVLYSRLGGRAARYIGVDILRYEGFPAQAEFLRADLNEGIPLPDGVADTVVAVETIEHLENPRSFMRELARLARPGGWVLATTPNILSALGMLSLAFRRRFVCFGDGEYPSHISPVLETDLVRIARECRLAEIKIVYSEHGRVALTPWHFPRPVSRIFPRALSDNILLAGRKT